MNDTLAGRGFVEWLQPFFSNGLHDPVIEFCVVTTEDVDNLSTDQEMAMWTDEGLASWEIVDRLLDGIE